MSLPVALQSVVFYVLACTPCAQVRHRQKAREQHKREREEKAKVMGEQPAAYQHPSPFNTNPYWQEEISMGPTLPKKSASKNSSQRGFAREGAGSSAFSVSEQTNNGGSRMNFGASNSVIAEDDNLSDDWNRRHGYQREDEELWGQWGGQRFKDAISKARDSAGRLIESTLGLEKEVTEQQRHDFYFPKNPPVNEYHPPVVSSKAPSRNAHQWMLQPPPSAKVMEGKVPVSRAASSGSKSSGRTLVGDDTQLSRLVHEKLVMEKLRKEYGNPTETELIESLFLNRTNQSLSIHRTRSLSFDTSDDSLDSGFAKRKTRLRPVGAPPGYDSSDDDSDSDVPAPFTHSSPRRKHSAAQRPKLETIQSTRSATTTRMSSKRSKGSKRQRSTRSKRFSGAASPVGDDTD
ncbi:hypothetical protein HYE67_008396 [Fusarium culmorum]|uniref:Signal peptide-containing protein n=1 Tax=Fusarium culmorum TaxID=5516 RepID=A0A2T4H7G6_FUSCU|nr:hypothetical protein FCULG_00003090 [Fusarium culmorum]QPC66165.1 hypothetical protein HYE67_008396 [Fusarium culmorum]